MSCVIYTITNNNVCIDYLACESIFKTELLVGSRGGFKHEKKRYDKRLVIGIVYLLINLMSCNGFVKKINYVIILKFPKRL